MNFLDFLTPINLLEEKDKFLSDSNYNPIFKYNREKSEIDTYLNAHPSKSTFISSILSEDSEKITKEAEIFFQTKLDEETLSAANEIISNGFTEITIDNPVQSVKDELEKALASLNINYKVVIEDRHGFNVRPNHVKKLVTVSSSYQPGIFPIISTVMHEMTHIVRKVNQGFNDSESSDNFLPTEEGLASFIGDKFSSNSLFHHAAEYKATEISLKSGFRGVFDYFISLGYDKDFAFQRSARHKFGFIDTSKPGDIMKPAMYFHYENKISKLDKKEVLKLFSGKISLDDAKFVTSYTGFIPEEKLVEYFNL